MDEAGNNEDENKGMENKASMEETRKTRKTETGMGRK